MRFLALYTVAWSCALVWRGTWLGWDCLYESFFLRTNHTSSSESNVDEKGIFHPSRSSFLFHQIYQRTLYKELYHHPDDDVIEHHHRILDGDDHAAKIDLAQTDNNSNQTNTQSPETTKRHQVDLIEETTVLSATDPGHATRSGILSHVVAVVGMVMFGSFGSVLAPPAAVSVIRDAAIRSSNPSSSPTSTLLSSSAFFRRISSIITKRYLRPIVKPKTR